MASTSGDSPNPRTGDGFSQWRSTALAVLVVLSLVSLAAAVQDGSGDPEVVVIDDDRRLSPRSGPVPEAEIETRSARSSGTVADRAAASDADADVEQGNDRSATEVTTRFQRLAAGEAVVYATDFSTLGPEWEVYDSPGHAGLGLRRPSAITIEPAPEAEADSVLTITARMGTTGDEIGQLVSGGMALRWPRTYGSYTFRMRVDPDPDQGTSGVAILWPWSNRWPQDGELDMVETYANRDTRTPIETNIHSLRPGAVAPYDRGDDRLLVVRHEGVDGSQWHTYRFEWRAESLTLAIDDREPVLITDDADQIPDWDMVPTFQLDAFPSPWAPDRQPVLRDDVVLEVDWLIVEQWPDPASSS